MGRDPRPNSELFQQFCISPQYMSVDVSAPFVNLHSRLLFPVTAGWILVPFVLVIYRRTFIVPLLRLSEEHS